MPDEVDLSPLEWLRSALMDLEESRRVVACRPEFEAGVRALVAELGAGLVEVRPTPNLPDGTAGLIFDPNAAEASTRQILQRGVHEARDRLRQQNLETLRREYLWPARLALPPDPRKAVIITGI